MASLKNIEQRISRIEQRNRKVESDKTWETSYTRRLFLTLFTYLAVGFYLKTINVQNPWTNAIVPAIAFMLSTLTMPFFRKVWLKYFH